VLILPDVRGPVPLLLRARRALLQAGHHAIALDYFGAWVRLGELADEVGEGGARMWAAAQLARPERSSYGRPGAVGGSR
jgi:hypothetical protein